MLILFLYISGVIAFLSAVFLSARAHIQSVRMRSIIKRARKQPLLPTTFKEDKNLKILSARFEAEANQSYLIFYAILFFTCVVGTIELLSIQSWPFYTPEGISLSALYAGLVTGSVVSIHACFCTYRKNFRLARSGRLGGYVLKDSKENPTTIDKIISARADPFLEFFFAFSYILIFALLFFNKITI